MKTNILIIGASRSGKTTLAERIAKEKGYSLISVDDIVSAFEVYPDLQIHHDGDAVDTANRLAPFLKRFFSQLARGSAFHNGIRAVIEGTHIDFEQLIPFLQSDACKDTYTIIGLTFNEITEQQLFDSIRQYDTEDDWTFECDDDELLGNVRYFLDRNLYFNELFQKYNITTYDTSFNRETVFDAILTMIDEL